MAVAAGRRGITDDKVKGPEEGKRLYLALNQEDKQAIERTVKYPRRYPTLDPRLWAGEMAPQRGKYPKFLVRNLYSNQVYLFKEINDHEARAAVGAVWLAKRLGIYSPPVRMVSWLGHNGTLQPWISESCALADLYATAPRLTDRLLKSSYVKSQWETIEVLDLLLGLINGVERHEYNVLVRASTLDGEAIPLGIKLYMQKKETVLSGRRRARSTASYSPSFKNIINKGLNGEIKIQLIPIDNDWSFEASVIKETSERLRALPVLYEKIHKLNSRLETKDSLLRKLISQEEFKCYRQRVKFVTDNLELDSDRGL